MGTLGRYLQEAREALGIDLREAAQQTRISIQYLKALEVEDFARLPGEVFVRGFLKNYGKFLRLDEAEVMKRYSESGQKKPAPVAVPAAAVPPVPDEEEPKRAAAKLPLEPFIWGTAIVIILLLFLFTALPDRHQTKEQQAAPQAVSPDIVSAPVPTAMPEKLYLEVVALENTWVLIRIDASPQKKAVLNKGESLTWSADERFLLSYGGAGAVKLILNGRELTVDEPKNAVVRDMTITASGIASRKLPVENARPTKPRRTEPTPQQSAATPSPEQPREQRRTAGQGSPATPVAPAPADVPAPAPPTNPPATEPGGAAQ